MLLPGRRGKLISISTSPYVFPHTLSCDLHGHLLIIDVSKGKEYKGKVLPLQLAVIYKTYIYIYILNKCIYVYTYGLDQFGT